MAKTTKEKLLEACGSIDLADVGEAALIDILVDKIKSLEKSVIALNGENGAERQRLYDETNRLREEQKRLRNDPLYGTYGQYYFIGSYGSKFILHMQGGYVVDLVETKKHGKKKTETLDYKLQQVSPAEFDAI